MDLIQGKDVTFIASAENWESILALSPQDVFKAELERRQRLLATAAPELHQGLAQQLVLAADEFIVAPTKRVVETTRIRASGSDVRTIIAGYHWFTDWGRDTMISLEGLHY